MRKGRRQEVTGLVVNADKPGVSRQTRRRLRAALHRATQAGTGLPGQSVQPAQAPHWQGQPAHASQLLGMAQFVHQIDPVQGGPLLAQARQLTRSPVDRANDALLEASRQDRAAARAKPAANATFRRLAAGGQAPALASGKPWWQPAAPAAPVLEKTDQQRREQRQEERQAARQAAGPAPGVASTLPAASPSPAAPDPNPPASKRPPMAGLLTYWAQIVICFLLGTVFQARLITLIGIVLVVILRYRRIQRWDVFGAAMVVAVLVGLGLRLS
jgi:hypothetical protein